jgi:hypothetical protein
MSIFWSYLRNFQTFEKRDLRKMHAKHAENCDFSSYFIWWKALFWKVVEGIECVEKG